MNDQEGNAVGGTQNDEGAARGALYMIGNAHLDPVWLWQWQEGFAEAKATFRSALDRMKEYDEFLFTSSSAALYEWIEINDPAMFEEIRERVAEGRWEIVGGWWIQPDCNIPGGESFVRQGLYGQRYFKEKLGVTATVGYNVDSFGHAASLPQILAKSGMPRYVFMRPHPHEQRLPSRLFFWESDDGSRVLTYRIPYEYCTWGKELDDHVRRCAAEFRGSVDRLMCFYGVGNHGGGPTRENIESIKRLSQDPDLPELLFSTPNRYFADVAAQGWTLPTIHDELQHHASGCYAAHSGVKQWNRQAENLLVSAEKMSALARLVTGLPYPADFARGWKGTLFNQFHDILAGTSIEPAYDDARYLYGESMAIASRNLTSAVQSISWQIDVQGEDGTVPIVVFNPHSWPLQAPVEVELGRVAEEAVLLDPDGVSVPFQRVRSLATVSGGRNRLCFLADLPAFGYTTYRVVQSGKAGDAPDLAADERSLENEFIRIEVDPETGALGSLFDKREGFEWLRRGGARPVVIEDASDTWSHGVLRFDRVAGEFTPVSIRLVERGPVKAVLRVESEYNRSRLVQDFTLYQGIDRVDVACTVDWHERFAMLKLNFVLNLHFTTGTYDLPYGTIQRPTNGEEEPGQTWIDMTGIGRNHGKRMGLSILNDSKYSFDMKEYEMNLTVLRSPIYAHHVPRVPEPDGDYTFIDQGVQRFTYSLVPHTEGWETGGTVRHAAVLNAPPIVQVETRHPGTLPQREGFTCVESESVVVSALKVAEEGEGIVLRCFETAGRDSHATVRLPRWNRTIEAVFSPHELKTFLVPFDAGAPTRETNLLEWEEG